MLTKQQVRELQLQMSHELNASSKTVLACALMILLLFGLVWFGA